MSAAHFSPAAKRDLREAIAFIGPDKPIAAERFLSRIESLCATLASSPDLGERRDDLMLALRGFSVASYVVYYVAVTDGIEVVRLLHGARDAKNEFSDS